MAKRALLVFFSAMTCCFSWLCDEVCAALAAWGVVPTALVLKNNVLLSCLLVLCSTNAWPFFFILFACVVMREWMERRVHFLLCRLLVLLACAMLHDACWDACITCFYSPLPSASWGTIYDELGFRPIQLRKEHVADMCLTQTKKACWGHLSNPIQTKVLQTFVSSMVHDKQWISKPSIQQASKPVNQ